MCVYFCCRVFVYFLKWEGKKGLCDFYEAGFVACLFGFFFLFPQFDILNPKHLSLFDVLEVVVEASWCAECCM